MGISKDWVVFGPQGQELNRFSNQLQAEDYAKRVGGTVRYVGR